MQTQADAVRVFYSAKRCHKNLSGLALLSRVLCTGVDVE